MRKYEQTDKYNYINDVFVDENLAHKNVRLNVNNQQREIQISPMEGKMLYVITRMARVKNAIELGVLAGYSAIWIAKALPKGGKLYAIEKNQSCKQQILENIKKCDQEDKIELLMGNAKETLKAIEKKGPFDMVFIDADKTNYCTYLDWAEKNIRKGGLIIGDNTFLFNSVYENNKPEHVKEKTWESMKMFNKRLANKEKYDSILFPTEEGMTIAIKKF